MNSGDNKVYEFIDEGEIKSTLAEGAEDDKEEEEKTFTIDEVRQKAAEVDPHGETIIKGDKYTEYKNFEGYYGDQWESPLQKKLLHRALTSKIDYISLEEQEKINWPTLELFPLDIEKDVMDDFTVVVVGRRRSGKSFLARWLMFHLKHRFPCGVVITGTKVNGFWQSYVPEVFIHTVEDMDFVLERFYRRQEFLKKHPELGIDPRAFLILDDVMADPNIVRYSKMLNKAFTEGRHYNAFTIVLLQDPRGIPPRLRENTDLCIMFRQFQKGRKEAVAEDYIDFLEEKKIQKHF